MKNPTLIISLKLAVVLFLLSACSVIEQKESFGYAELRTNYRCDQDLNPESQSFMGLLLDNTSKTVSVAENIEIKVWDDSNFGTYLKGWCEVKGIFKGIPLTNPPYKVEFYKDSELLPRTKSINLEDLAIYEK